MFGIDHQLKGESKKNIVGLLENWTLHLLIEESKTLDYHTHTHTQNKINLYYMQWNFGTSHQHLCVNKIIWK